MAKWLYLIIPAGLGLAAFRIMEPAQWEKIGSGLIFVLSLLGAAVLVRLARGMPVSDTDYLEVKEMRDLSTAVKRVYRAMIVLFAAIMCSIIGLGTIRLTYHIGKYSVGVHCER